jgi:uncharacterized delta-60 repeat protein
VAGYQGTSGIDWAIRKYDVNGDLDTLWGSSGMVNFNSGGLQNDYARAIAIDAERNIYVAGYQSTNGSDWAIIKYDANGATSTGWGTNGKVTYNSGAGGDVANAITIDAERNIYVAGNQATNGGDWVVRKYDANGDLDTSWGSSGMVGYLQFGRSQSDYAYAIAIDGDRNTMWRGIRTQTEATGRSGSTT